MLVCEALDAANQCTAWTEIVNPFIPTMTAAEGQQIGQAIFFAFVAVRVAILVAKAIEERI